MVPRSRAVPRALAGLSVLLAVVSLAFVVLHPSVRARTTGEIFTCLATWDIVLNDAYNDPDGFPPLKGERIGERCVTRAHRNFRISVVIGSGAAGSALAATFLAARGRRRARRETPRVEHPAVPH